MEPKTKRKKLEYKIRVFYAEEGEGKEDQQIRKEFKAWLVVILNKYCRS